MLYNSLSNMIWDFHHGCLLLFWLFAHLIKLKHHIKQVLVITPAHQCLFVLSFKGFLSCCYCFTVGCRLSNPLWPKSTMVVSVFYWDKDSWRLHFCIKRMTMVHNEHSTNTTPHSTQWKFMCYLYFSFCCFKFSSLLCF